MNKHTISQWILCLSIPALFSLLLLIPRFQQMDYTMYDLLLGLKPAVAESPEILLLNVDDDAISRVGTWPWSRAVLANGLLRLGEFGAFAAVFDIEYVDPSPMGVAPSVLNEDFPRVLNNAFDTIDSNMFDLFGALAQGMIPLDEAEDFIYQLSDINRDHRDRLLESARAIARDNDEYHGVAAGLFGRAYYTVTQLDSEEMLFGSEQAAEYARSHFSVPNLDIQTDRIPSLESIQPTILPIASRAASAGFPNVHVDSDGVRRRIDLVHRGSGQYFGQLAFRPLLDYLHNPIVEVHDRHVLLRGARYPDGNTYDVRIPRSVDGRMLINWPPAGFDETFRQLSYSRVFTLDEYENDLVDSIERLDEARFLQMHPFSDELIPWYRDIQDMRAAMFEEQNREMYHDYLAERAGWYEAVDDVLQPDTLNDLLSQIEELLQRDDLPDNLHSQYTEIAATAPDMFAETRKWLDETLALRQSLQEELAGAFVIIGWTGVSTTDIGVNPFDEQYMNVGTHAAVANTILQRQFLIELPYLYSILGAFLLSVMITLLVRKTSARRTTILGFSLLIFLLAGIWVLFSTTGMFLRPIVLISSLATTFIALSLLKFYFTEGEKRYISGAFSRYLSQDVVQAIINDPSKLNLGGEKRELTAIFTDIKGFSTISEQLDPQDLVRLLNRYLSAMSDIILELGGTIDKYEGDAIIGFFGAPLPVPDHAYRSCLAGVRMKQKEAELNALFLEEGVTPTALQTRIGMNSGDMVVGNMGTERKMDYTMMGHNVNLAARLEGVNKQYDSWILASESTVNQARAKTPPGEGLIFRRLDRVRVVGVKEPVRLYEVVAEESGASQHLLQMLQYFEKGLELFEAGSFVDAEQHFRQALAVIEHDGPTQTYVKRCHKFITSPPPANWDGVFSLTQK